MGLEVATYVSDLVATNPLSTDAKSLGDDHIRAIKTALRNTFPNASGPFYGPTTAVKTSGYSVLASDQNCTFLVDTTSGSLAYTLPTLVSGQAGWECHFIKTNTGTNPLFIAPPTGTIQSGEYAGLVKARRCIPGRRTTALWTGTAWILTRVVGHPVNSTIQYYSATLPVGFEWPNGQTLTSASTNYPEFYVTNGNSGVTIDKRGRVTACKDDIGGTSANRLTGLTGGLNGDTLGAVGGEEAHTLLAAGMPVHTHIATSTVTDPTHQHLGSASGQIYRAASDGAGTAWAVTTSAVNSGFSATGITVATSNANAGSGAAHNNVQPTIIMSEILVVE